MKNRSALIILIIIATALAVGGVDGQEFINRNDARELSTSAGELVVLSPPKTEAAEIMVLFPEPCFAEYLKAANIAWQASEVNCDENQEKDDAKTESPSEKHTDSGEDQKQRDSLPGENDKPSTAKPDQQDNGESENLKDGSEQDSGKETSPEKDSDKEKSLDNDNEEDKNTLNPPSGVKHSLEETRLLALVNNARIERDIPPLKPMGEIIWLARLKSDEIVETGKLSHTSPTYGSVAKMLLDAGISFHGVGENLARVGSIERAFDMWMDSEGHRKNILAEGFTHTGIGIAYEGNRLVITHIFINKK